VRRAIPSPRNLTLPLPLTVFVAPPRAGLCPGNETLTEECFMRRPLEFDRTKQQLRWNNGTRLSIPGVWVDRGTNPIGSTWARNPIPRIDFGVGGGSDFTGQCRGKGRGPNCVNFKPPCDDSWLKVHLTDPASQVPQDEQGECSGDWTEGTIVDEVSTALVASCRAMGPG
jgi:hypothetical protein